MQKIDLRILDGKDFNQIMAFGLSLKDQNLEGKINAHNVFSLLIDKVKEQNSKEIQYIIGRIKHEIWNLEKFFGWNTRFFSQAGQDKLIFEKFFKNKMDGYFVDLGAYDGVEGSNTYFFEKFFRWKGVLVEPSKNQYLKLTENRNNNCINKAISKTNEKFEFIDVVSGYKQMSGLNQSYYKDTLEILNSDLNSKTDIYQVETSTFKDLVLEKEIDYLSIDIEGGELDVLSSIDFNTYKIKVISVENNKPNQISYKELLLENGYNFFDFCGADEIYYNPSLF
tara:strand:+ start:1167 stop:2009 length:843 start_codon:yes stop_codon:yes gene_type:complete